MTEPGAAGASAALVAAITFAVLMISMLFWWMLRCLPLSHCCQSSVVAGVIVTGGRTVASHASYAIGAWDPVAAPGMPKEERQKLARQLVSATYA